MLTPIVTEIHRASEPVSRDTFIATYERRAPGARDAGTNVVSLAAHRSHAGRPVPARAA